MAAELDMTRAFKLLEELEPKYRKRAIHGGIRRTAAKLRKTVVANLKASGLKWNKEVIKGVRPVIYRKVVGFKITVGTKKQKKLDYDGMSTIEKNKTKAFRRLRIVPLWAEGGTVERRTKGKGFFGKGASRGSMRAYRFMEKSKPELIVVENSMRKEIYDNIERTVKKYGSRLE